MATIPAGALPLYIEFYAEENSGVMHATISSGYNGICSGCRKQYECDDAYTSRLTCGVQREFYSAERVYMRKGKL